MFIPVVKQEIIVNKIPILPQGFADIKTEQMTNKMHTISTGFHLIES